jgi:hypothetical protein
MAYDDNFKKVDFAADAVAHPAEQKGAERTDQKARGEQRDRAKERRHWMTLFEEFDRQDRGQASEYVEVIPLDDITARRGGDHASEVRRDMSSHMVLPLVSGTRQPVVQGSICPNLMQGCRPQVRHRREWQPTFHSW